MLNVPDYAVLWTPQAELQAVFRQHPELRSVPVALMSDESRQARVFQMNEQAEQQGVVSGLSAAQAMARCQGLEVRHRLPSREEAFRRILHAASLAFSPSVEETAPGAWTIDLRHLSPIHWNHLPTSVLGRLQERGITARLGASWTPRLAWYAARQAQPFFEALPGGDFPRSLPLEWAEPTAGQALILKQWGLRTLGDLGALTQSDVALRLGAEGLALWERAVCPRARPLKLVQDPLVYEEELEPDFEVETLPSLLLLLEKVLDALLERMELMQHVVSKLHLRLKLADRGGHQHLFHVSQPTSDRKILLSMLATHLETLRTSAAVCLAWMKAEPVRIDLDQGGLFENALRNPQRWVETVARLGALAGKDRIGRPVLQDSHRPDAFYMQVSGWQHRLAETKEGATPLGLLLRRFRPARAAVVEFREEIPFYLKSGEITGTVKSCRGPWKKSGDWWSGGGQGWAVQNWDIELEEGGLYRITLMKSGCFLEGVYG